MIVLVGSLSLNLAPASLTPVPVAEVHPSNLASETSRGLAEHSHPAPAGPSADSTLRSNAAAATSLKPPAVPTARPGPFRFSEPHPSVWGASGRPPGERVPYGTPLGSPLDTSPDSASENSTVFSSGHCAGLYPEGGPSTYYDKCVGHDEPGIQFYSSVPGSGGNVTWNVTLPIDTGPSRNQSNLYVAVWFGMTLTDPLAWLDQCFLELQFYPDSLWSGPASGRWIAAAVAWQIEASTGYEDPCYYAPLALQGGPVSSYLNMTGGDRLTVSMTGWAGDPLGEAISVVDRTTGNSSNLNLYDPYGNFPLDPAYSTNTWENGLQWTPGGEFPVVFAFETGHGRNPNYPSNSTSNYCVPGRPPATAANPYVPCPSYDPASWVNDSLQPWRIGVPEFRSSQGPVAPVQVGFGQDFGGINLDAAYSSCAGNEGSTYCSYPWYSYSCSTHTFQFGATDYLGMTNDFGKYRQYAATSETDDLGFGYYAPTNFSLPACGAPTASLLISSSGGPGTGVYFLSKLFPSSGLLSNLSLGAYSVHAIGAPGARFTGWTTSGNVSVDLTSSAWTTVWVNGSGGLTAAFGSAPATTRVTFDDSIATGSVAVLPDFLEGPSGGALATIANGGSLSLAPQIYSILAYPPPGYNFTGWTVSGPGAVVAAAGFPDSWFVVTGVSASVTVTAGYGASSTRSHLSVSTYGNGTVTVAGTTAASFTKNLSVGTYRIGSTPQPGWTFSYWYAGGIDALADHAPSSNLSLENGTSYLEAVFVELPATVHVLTVPAAGGRVSFGPPTGYGNNSKIQLSIGYWTVYAVSYPGYRFTGWAVNRSLSGWAESPGEPVSTLDLNASVDLRATFAVGSAAGVGFRVTPSSAGSIDFNFVTYTNGGKNTSAASGGAYPVEFVAAPGYHLASYSNSGPITFDGVELAITGPNGLLSVTFAPDTPVPYAVTFVTDVPTGLSALLNGTLVTQGETVWLVPGVYNLSIVAAGLVTFTGWTSAGSITPTRVDRANTSVSVTGGGSVYALGVPFLVGNVSVTPAVADVGTRVVLHAIASGPGGVNVTWSGVPSGCPNRSSSGVDLGCSPGTPGVYSIGADLSDPAGADLAAGPFPLVVELRPAIASFSSTRTNVTVGASTTLTIAVPAGAGVPPLRYLYTGLPTGCVSRNASSLICAPNASGSATVSAFVYDGLGLWAQASLPLLVNPAPRLIGAQADPSPITVGLPENFSARVVGGTAPITIFYRGLPPGCPPSALLPMACKVTSAGAYTVTIVATDSDGIVAQTPVSVDVNPLPAIASFGGVPTTIVLGNSTTLSVSAHGGTGTLRYAYAGLPPGCASRNTSALTCVPTKVGNYTVTVSAADSLGVTGTKAVTIHVLPVPSGAPPSARGGPGLGSSALWVAAAVVIALAILTAVLFYRWRRRAPTAADRTGPDP